VILTAFHRNNGYGERFSVLSIHLPEPRHHLKRTRSRWHFYLSLVPPLTTSEGFCPNITSRLWDSQDYSNITQHCSSTHM
jgi:hypothetical protein